MTPRVPDFKPPAADESTPGEVVAHLLSTSSLIPKTQHSACDATITNLHLPLQEEIPPGRVHDSGALFGGLLGSTPIDCDGNRQLPAF